MNVQHLFPRTITLLLVLILAPLISASAQGVTQSSLARAEDLPVVGVTLFTSGVGNFRHEGMVNGNVEITLPFAANDVDDLLKSMVVQDYDGGVIETVTYPSKDPLNRILSSFSLDISDNPSLATMLERARGERIVVVGDQRFEGSIAGIEYRATANDEPRVPVLNLITGDGIRQILLNEIQRFEFLDSTLQAELDAALAVIADNRQQDKKLITIRFSGQGERRVALSYIREVPLWKTSYRLSLDAHTAELQGWAMVENTGESDWNDISLGLATGSPLSFKMDLYSPIYIPRPEVAMEQGPAVEPQRYYDGIARQERMDTAPKLQSAPLSMASAAPATRELNLTQGVNALAIPEGAFLYRIERPLSVPRRSAALIPIIETNIPITKLSVYDRNVLLSNPLKAVRITNSTGIRLPKGPVTIFDNSVYSGDAQLTAVAKDAERLLSYAVDTESTVLLHSQQEPEQISSVRIVNGVLESTIKRLSETRYDINNIGSQSTQYVIIHPKRERWIIAGEVQPVSETQDQWQFETNVPAGEIVSLAVNEERIESVYIALSNMQDNQISFYYSQSAIDNATKGILNRLRALRAEQVAKQSAVEEIEMNITRIHDEQNRIRQNLEALESGSALYKRYTGILNTQEDELQEYRKQFELAVQEEKKAAERLRRFIQEL